MSVRQKPIEAILADQGHVADQTRQRPRASTIASMVRAGVVDGYVSPDGIPRSHDDEYRLNDMVMSALSGAAGEELLAYLRSITVHNVTGPGGDLDRALVHREGARWLLGVIESRIAYGERRLPQVSRGTESDDGR